MNFQSVVLKPANAPSVARALLRIGSAIAEPRPLAHAGTPGAFFEAVTGSHDESRWHWNRAQLEIETESVKS